MDLKSIAEAYQSVQEKKLDPVGKEDGDVDNDGDKDSSDSYLMKRRAAIKKAMKKEEVEQIDELSKKTMGSYIAKGAKDLADRRFDQGDSEKRKYDPDEADDKEDKKLDKREQGIARAAKKLSKEGYQRDPEGGEEKARQRRRSQKGGDRTEKVRGERTPMPPRGDKRREDFERWYAANVR